MTRCLNYSFIPPSRQADNMKQHPTSRARRLGRRIRRGISILETIVSIAVAMIGVFGVFVLIPFAIRQAEIGLNLESAMVVGRNTLANFEAQGFYNVNRWYDPQTGAAPAQSQIFCIDPMGYTMANLDGGNQAALYQFPKMATTSVVQFDRITLADQNGNPFNWAMAKRMFGGQDELVFSDATSELGAPQQIFDEIESDADAKRQVGDRATSMVFVVPEFVSGAAFPSSYRTYTVVSVDRVFDQTVSGGRPADDDRVFNVFMPGTATAPTGIQYGGGDFTISEQNQSTDPEAELQIRRSSWVMLVRVDVSDANPNNHFVDKIGFYRTVDASQSETMPTDFDISLIGPDFEFSNPSTHQTYMVALPEAVAVYERTVRQEQKSNWNF